MMQLQRKANDPPNSTRTDPAERAALAHQDCRGQRVGTPRPIRPEEPAHPRHRRRADQPGRVGVVSQAHRRRALPNRQHLLADRIRRPHDHETTGEAICAFVVLKRSRPTGDEVKKIATELRHWVAKEIGPIAKPTHIRFGDNLPKTRSGKITRRLLRQVAEGEAVTQTRARWNIWQSSSSWPRRTESRRLVRRVPEAQQGNPYGQ